MATSIFSQFLSFFRSTGPMLPDGADLQKLIQSQYGSATGIVAHAGGGQANATPLVSANGQGATFSEVNTIVTNADSVLAPYPALPGTEFYISNMSAQSLQVFGQGTDQMIAHASTTVIAAATGVAQAGGLSAYYVCTTAGQWKQTLSA